MLPDPPEPRTRIVLWTDHQVVLCEARIEEILELRHAVLRPGLPRSAALFAGDDAVSTHHFGAFMPPVALSRPPRNLCCLSFMRNDPGENPLPDEWQGQLAGGSAAWQLRGMATDPAWRRRGIGGALLRFAAAALPSAATPQLLWCNARQEAVPFYRKEGWRVVSPEFMIEGVGRHFKMATLVSTRLGI